MSVCIVEAVVMYQAWCNEHGVIAPVRESEDSAREDAEHHADCGCDI